MRSFSSSAAIRITKQNYCNIRRACSTKTINGMLSPMRVLLLVGLLSAANAQSCGKTSAPMRPYRSVVVPMIVGGVETAPSSHPWVVSLQTYGDHFCGGSLIRTGNQEESNVILTAAHCLMDLDPSDITVVAGAHNFDLPKAGQQSVKALQFALHEKYNFDTSLNDIAVVKLARPIKFSSTIQPVCLPPAAYQVPDNTEGIVAGWGHKMEGAYDTSRVLQQVTVPVVSSTTCIENYRPQGIYPKEMICAGYTQGGKDACQGDSGGPFVFKEIDKYTLQGIVSFGEGCARAGKPGVYTRVSNYIPWIAGKMAIFR